MDGTSVTDGMLNSELRRESHSCSKKGKFIRYIQAIPIYVYIIMLIFASSLLCASFVVLFIKNPMQLEGFPGYNGSTEDLLSPLPTDMRINYIRQIAPENFQDISVPLNETDHHLRDLVAVSYLVDGINAEVDPCEDFYEFACGNYESYGKMRRDRFRDTRAVLRRRFQEILDNWDTKNSHSRPMSLAIDFYNQCRNETIENGAESIYKTLNDIGGWPSIDPHWSEEKFDFLRMAAKARRVYSHNPFFNIYVFSHPQNRTRNIIHLDFPDLSIPDDIFGTDSINETNLRIYRAQYVHVVEGPSEDPGSECDANETYSLERRLALAMSPDFYLQPLKIMTLKEFQLEMDKVTVTASHAKIDWIDFLNEIFITSGTTVKADQEIYVVDMDYMRKLVKILDTSTPRTLANYMQWTLVRKWLPFFSRSNMPAVMHSDFSSLLGGFEEDDSAAAGLDSACLTETVNMFDMPLVNEFVRRSIFTPSDRTAVNDMATALRESFVEMIHDNGWISDSARAKALEKLEGMTQFVGYPDWATNDTWMEDEFQKLQFGNDPVDNMVSLLQWTSDRNFNALTWDGIDLWMLPAGIRYNNFGSPGTLPVHKQILLRSVAAPRSIFYISPFEVNGYNWGKGYNSILIPLGIAIPPFYLSSGPAYVNFGQLGRVIGHEIAHGFDHNGIKYDAHGNENEWLSPDDQEKFEENARCFVEQYSQYEVLPGKRINGSFTLNENVADDLGLELAYRAYKRAVEREQVEQPKKLLGLEKLTPEQLFFLAYARVNTLHL